MRTGAFPAHRHLERDEDETDETEAGQKRLTGDTERQASSGEVTNLRREMSALKVLVADLTIENRLFKKSTFGDRSDDTVLT